MRNALERVAPLQCDLSAALSYLDNDDPRWWAIATGRGEGDRLVQLLAHHRLDVGRLMLKEHEKPAQHSTSSDYRTVDDLFAHAKGWLDTLASSDARAPHTAVANLRRVIETLEETIAGERQKLAIAMAALDDINEGPILRIEPGSIIFKDEKQTPILVARAALTAIREGSGV